jgi:hypothetical protein
MNNIILDALEEMERAHYADNRVELVSLLRMALSAREDITRMEKMLDDAGKETDYLTKLASLVFEMVEDADSLKELQKALSVLKLKATLSGVPL